MKEHRTDNNKQSQHLQVFIPPLHLQGIGVDTLATEQLFTKEANLTPAFF
ncbi:hypothetical protein C8R30_1352 [Nitrosomonas nitrosa]|uniref:Uncharacterized protein n=1 Tax=Nitrosomonas nitrosa TaxID=52442 RepID=A0A1I4MYW1_9PROT|nr:hypothetical protein [Nitrosomonas nitrosa]PTQ90580.1 hypothetical protein C8R30_1352 [Nitrosomonas nitrosa]CAE6490095.1 hypothetical protein NMYAN_100123 [Nitrosomonas nitrosa]SFM08451.1 hypothetical protein SAMN05421880_10618 [Nitrosomonas nitrosa]HNP52231.1 hypothetical protein [Nitrosomonas nitrosa]